MMGLFRHVRLPFEIFQTQCFILYSQQLKVLLLCTWVIPVILLLLHIYHQTGARALLLSYIQGGSLKCQVAPGFH